MKQKHILILLLAFFFLMYFRKKTVLVPVVGINGGITKTDFDSLKTRVTNLEAAYSNREFA